MKNSLMEKHKFDVTICIVNYNSSALIMKALESIHIHTSGVHYEVIVVNNSIGDKDYSELFIWKEKLNIKFIDNKLNVGFSKANNIGYKHSNGKYFLSYNPDLYLLSNTILKAYVFLESHIEYSALTVKFLNPDKTIQKSGFYKEDGTNFILSNIPYSSKFVKQVNFQSLNQTNEVVDIDVACGAFLFVRSSVYSSINGYDEDFFLYGEDWEICSRIRKFGKIALLNNTKVIHDHGGASSKEFNEEGENLNIYTRKGVQMMVSVMLWQKKEFGFLVVSKIYFLIIISLLLSLFKRKISPGQFLRVMFPYTKMFIFMIFNIHSSYRTM